MSVQLAHDGTNHVCYETPDGIRRRYLGCRHDSPREGIRHSDALTLPAPRSADHDPARYHGDGQADARPIEAPDLGRSPVSSPLLPDGSDGRDAPLPARAAHPAPASMSGTSAARGDV